MKVKTNFGELILTCIIIIILLFTLYGKVILNPNSFLFSAHGDGIKNYYTYAYYIKHNSSNIEFEGMNYPYHENILFVDAHPFPAFVLKQASTVFPKIEDYSIGILNLMMILSFAISVVIVFLIFKELKVNFLFSFAGSLGIIALSPQIFRMQGHFALSYSLVIPLVILLLIRYFKRPNYIFSAILLILVIVIAFFTHAYLGMIPATLIFTYGFISLFTQREVKLTKRILLILSSAIGVFTFYLFSQITDIHQGRTSNPWGIFHAHAEISTVFLPVFFGPFHWVRNAWFPDAKNTWEGQAYIGLSTIIILTLLIISYIKNAVKKKSLSIEAKMLDQPILRILLASGTIVLLFSMLYPFRYLTYKLVDQFEIIKQFRSIGRFAWAFYFVATITSVYVAYRLYNRNLKNYKYISYLFLLVPLFNILEGSYYHTHVSKDLTKCPNYFNLRKAETGIQQAVDKINSASYQAIIGLPFYHIGARDYYKAANDNIYKPSFLLSYHLNLPLINNKSARAPIPNSRNVMQLLAPDFYDKEIRKSITSKKPFLIVCSNDELDYHEKQFLDKSQLIAKYDNFSLYEITTDAALENTAKRNVKEFYSIEQKLYNSEGFLVSDTGLYFKLLDFTDSSGISYGINNGSLSVKQKEYTTLYNVPIKKIRMGEKYIARVWLYNKGDNFGQDCISGFFCYRKIKDGTENWINATGTNTTHVINGKWNMVEIPFSIDDSTATYELFYKGRDRTDKKIIIDKLLFYHEKLDIYRIEEDNLIKYLFHNNHLIPFPEKELYPVLDTTIPKLFSNGPI